MSRTADIDISTWMSQTRERVDKTLSDRLRPADTLPSTIHEAMRYTVLAGGKRVRPILAVAAAETLGRSADEFLGAFCALELIHSYSLVHDDLPALDDDDLRRGKPTAHVVFGEAIAILAGDALLTEAFRWLSEPIASVPAERQLRTLRIVADAIDSTGMIGGQVLDLEGETIPFSGEKEEALVQLERIHANKTGQLLVASVLTGGMLAGADDRQLELLRTYGSSLGLAFQVVDDILDVIQSSETLGKTAGKDSEQGKLTYPALLGLEGARAKAAQLIDDAIDAADRLSDDAELLSSIARYVRDRTS